MSTGLCECGCGVTTNVASKSMYRNGALIARKGEHYRFIQGHHPPRGVPLELRIEDKIERDPETGCWNWTAYKGPLGYGRVSSDRKAVNAHRAVWELDRGPIPEGLELDHLCRNPACVNPDHLEPVTHAENVRRAGLRVRTGACHRGHAMTPENTYVSPKDRKNCRECTRITMRARRANKRKQVAADV